MTEEELNEKLIKLELQNVCQDCLYLDKIVPIIRKMLSEEYKTGLEQSRFDKNMLERENQELKKQLEEMDSKLFFTKNELEMRQKSIDNNLRQQKEFIEWLEDKLNMCDGFLDTVKSDLEEISYAGRASGKTYIATQIMKNEIAKKCYEEVLSKYKEIIGVKDE